MSAEFKGFEAAYEERGTIRPGSMAHLMQVDREKKRREREEREAREREEKEAEKSRAEPVDKSLLIPETPVQKMDQLRSKSGPGPENEPGPKSGPVTKKGPPKKVVETGPENEPGPKSGPEDLTAGEVLLEKNYMRFDMDIFSLMPELTGAEYKVYVDLVRRSYGQISPRNICSCTYTMIMKATGITSRTTMAKSVEALIKKGLVRHLFVARRVSEMTIYRVFLPGETPGKRSRTVVTFKK